MLRHLTRQQFLRDRACPAGRTVSTSAPRHTERRKESWNAPPEEQNNLPKQEWQSVFNLFRPRKGITVDVVNKLQKGINLRPSAVKEWMADRKERFMKADQTFLHERVQALGFELATAHFVVHRGGKIRFKGATEWIQRDEDGEYDLPRHFTSGLQVEAIDISGLEMYYEGLECMMGRDVKWLSVAGCPYMDDWCVDRICAQYASTLEHLDISKCTKITERGIAALARLRELKSLNLTGLDTVPDIQLTCLLLEECSPQLQITGVDYLVMP